jgi:shikimate dehydrogenase
LIRQIDGSTKVYAILGDPVAALRSPQVFNALFERRNLNAVLVALHVSAGDLPKVWEGLKALRNIGGIIFTMPHKVAAMKLMDTVRPGGMLAGAINVARIERDGRWTGDMFDGIGCVRGLMEQGHALSGGDCFIAGCGGAGAAIAVALAGAGVARLVLTDVDTEKRDALLDRIAKAFPNVRVQSADAPRDPFDFAINATPLGMRPGDPLPFLPETLPQHTVIVDVVPKPEVTPLLEAALKSGHRIQPGKLMTLGQAEAIADFWMESDARRDDQISSTQ